MFREKFEKYWGKIKKIRINKLLYNNKFLMIFSLLSSIVLWFAVSSESSYDITKTISDIPIDITLSEGATQDGLRIFSRRDDVARVDISGNRIIVGQVTKDNIQISAPQAASTIVTPGNYPLELSAKKVGVLKDYEIVSEIHPAFTTVIVDRYREAEFDVEAQVKFSAKQDYFVGNTVLSAPKVKISGPESEISRVKKVVVKAEIPGEISSPTSVTAPIELYDAYNTQISGEFIVISESEIEITIPVLMKKKFPLTAEFKNIPENVTFVKNFLKMKPNILEIAGPEDILNSTVKICLQAGDFEEVNLQNNRFKISIILPQGCRNLNEINEAEIELNMAQFREKTLNISEFNFKNLPEDKTAKIYNTDIDVKILAPYTKINSIKASDIVAEIDFSEKIDATGSMEMPLKFKINNFDNAWVIGNYSVNVQIG